MASAAVWESGGPPAKENSARCGQRIPGSGSISDYSHYSHGERRDLFL